MDIVVITALFHLSRQTICRRQSERLLSTVLLLLQLDSKIILEQPRPPTSPRHPLDSPGWWIHIQPACQHCVLHLLLVVSKGSPDKRCWTLALDPWQRMCGPVLSGPSGGRVVSSKWLQACQSGFHRSFVRLALGQSDGFLGAADRWAAPRLN